MTNAVKLGDITLTEFEIPSELRLGGEQSISVKRFVGNSRALDVMGSEEFPIEFAGAIRGPDALKRAQSLDAMRIAGREIAFTWNVLSYTVVISSFEWKPSSAREVPYRIALEVVRNEAAATPAPQASPTTMIKKDLTTAQKLQKLVDDIELAEQMEKATDAAKKVQNMVTAPTEALRSILKPVISAQGIVKDLIVNAEKTLSAVNAVGAVIPGLRGRDLSGGLLRQLGAMEDASNLYDLGAILGRVETNLSAVSTAGAAVVMGGADLFKVALKTFGDATEWATIARANGRTDPLVDGLAEITVPATPRGTGGVLG